MASIIDSLNHDETQVSMLIKGSRSSKMELVVQDVIQWRNSLSVQQTNLETN